eukprot:364869-Chlamydomonas_euryale.AAC.22
MGRGLGGVDGPHRVNPSPNGIALTRSRGPTPPDPMVIAQWNRPHSVDPIRGPTPPDPRVIAQWNRPLIGPTFDHHGPYGHFMFCKARQQQHHAFKPTG